MAYFVCFGPDVILLHERILNLVCTFLVSALYVHTVHMCCFVSVSQYVHAGDYSYTLNGWLDLPACCVCAHVCARARVSSRESWASSALLFQRNRRRPGGNYTPLLRLVKTSFNQGLLLQSGMKYTHTHTHTQTHKDTHIHNSCTKVFSIIFSSFSF